MMVAAALALALVSIPAALMALVGAIAAATARGRVGCFGILGGVVVFMLGWFATWIGSIAVMAAFADAKQGTTRAGIAVVLMLATFGGGLWLASRLAIRAMRAARTDDPAPPTGEAPVG